MSISTGQDKLARIQAATDYLLRCSEDGWIAGYCSNCWLSSIFQPVFGANGREVVGHAAYIRSDTSGESALSPLALAGADAQLVHFDRLCRTIHALNYFGDDSRQGSLFVSVQPRLLESVKDDHGLVFGRILDLIGVKTARVVIEIPIEVNRDWRLLKHVISNYRHHGYQVAVNHGGANDDWMEDTGGLYFRGLYFMPPDIVRVNASALVRHNETRLLVDAVHRSRGALLVRDIETAQQMATAIRAGADYLQGRFLGEPIRAIATVAAHAAVTGQQLEYAW
ncbi:MAG: EAL domain-containing protein [Nitrosospira sp.]|nr:EAL domain-containing protein [Nitrosospira sp.]